jgi:hypothetical protein
VAGADVVRSFFERMEARDWEGAAGCLAGDVVVEMAATAERLVGTAYLAFQRGYPEGWTITVLEVVGDRRVSARVRVDHAGEVFLCAGFHDVNEGVIRCGVEHWVTLGAEAVGPGRRQVPVADMKLSVEVR